ncbi:MAG: hypothetical protein FWE38_05585, partial [Firmicutes bacterium]|nr:hypothetical protein [Bacillota bacterium]
MAQPIPVTSWADFAATSFAGGTGTNTDPYIIETPAQIAFMAQRVNNDATARTAYFQITQDIDMAGHNWSMMSTGTGNVFHGSLVAVNNATINNLVFESAGVSAGFFGHIGEGARIEGLTFNNALVSSVHYGMGTPNVGLLAGRVDGEGIVIRDITVDADSAITRSMPTTSISTIGGLVGTVGADTDLLLEDIQMHGDVAMTIVSNGGNGTGGIIGAVSGLGARAVLNNVVNTGDVTTDSGHAGGLVGRMMTDGGENEYSVV